MWTMRPNYRKIKFMVVTRSRTYAPGYGDITLGFEKLEVKSLRVLFVVIVTRNHQILFLINIIEELSESLV